LYSPVRWSETITALGEQGITQMVEVGPGKVLQGLVKRINKAITCVSFNSTDTFSKAKELTQTSE
jgi:[acyl-carrier-protein] S-malonyltransferase